MYLRNYSKRTFQLLSIRSTTPVQTRNAKILKSVVPGETIPVDMKFHNKTYICTHSGTPRTGRGRGKRPHLHSRKISCPAQINACVRHAGEWEVLITGQKTGHNHEVSREVYNHYHESRQVFDEAVLATVHTLTRTGANRKRILENITQNTSVEPQMKDVRNLCARLRRESYAFPTIEERIRAILEDFSSKPGNVTRVYANEEGFAECISIQSWHMQSMFKRFPEVLLIDATHDTNSSKYKLFSFMIHDAMDKALSP
ncbi:hypothetical protein PR002_g24776 [Phytophthora rubi]|uniref:ZSWIM1/3 RNaseH-like domain-containing protein n=1 Tax=Phytophthora rubi TaxID=129364 RepID=A0A6A3ICE8_9STRA|nr:hypothetical protein PR002_g24776 [Phytophthora rubi]